VRLALPTGRARTLVVAMFCGCIGTGSYGAGAVVFFTRSVGLSAGQVGLGLSLAAFVALMVNVPFGHAVDVFGPKRTTILVTLAEGTCFALTTTVHSFAGFLPVIVALGTALQAGIVARAALIAVLFDDADRVRISALLRSVNNVAFLIGTLLAGVALSLDTRAAYVGLMAFSAAFSVLSAIGFLPIAPGRRRRREEAARPSVLSAVRDLPYLGVALVAAFLEMGDLVLGIGVPLWIVTQTDLSKGVAAWLIGFNTVLVVLFQVRAARGATTVEGARTLQRRTGVLLAGAALAVALSGSVPGYWALPVLTVGVALLTGGELFSSAATWLLRYELADPGSQGRYAGAFGLAESSRDIVVPVTLTLLIGQLDQLGWVILAGVVIAISCAAGPAARLCERTRPGRHIHLAEGVAS
jgi:MFS family permease